MLPGKKGISLPLDQFSKLVAGAAALGEALRRTDTAFEVELSSKWVGRRILLPGASALPVRRCAPYTAPGRGGRACLARIAMLGLLGLLCWAQAQALQASPGPGSLGRPLRRGVAESWAAGPAACLPAGARRL